MSDIPSFYPGTSIADVMRLRAERDAALARAEQWRQMADRLAAALDVFRALPGDTASWSAAVKALAAHDALTASEDQP